MIRICQTASIESKFVFMRESDHQKSETVPRKFNRPFCISWILLALYHYAISQIVSAESEAIFKELKINYSIYVNNELKRTRTNLSSFQFVPPVRCLNYLRNRTRMTWITRIFTDTINPRASVFHSIPSASIGVHPRLDRMALPDEKILAAELENTRSMLEGRRLGAER